jgi:chemotaxis protein histidine kinase CheA
VAQRKPIAVRGKRTPLRVIEASKELKAKVGDGGFSTMQNLSADRAMKSVARLFGEQAKGDLAALDHAFAALCNGARGPEASRALFLPAFALKSMGGTCGYPLLSHVADSLCALLDATEAEALPSRLAALESHIDAIRAILKDEIRGDGGALGRELLKGLQAIAAR